MYKFTYDNRDGAKKLWRIGIKNNYASVEVCELPTSFPTQSKITWNNVLDIGEAVDADIAFDGRWLKNETHEKWVFTTINEPWFFWLKVNGDLYGMQMGNQSFLLAQNVSQISVIRGWKNTYHWNHDQGIIVSYLKTDGYVYYRNYCQQPPDQPALWEIERQVSSLPAQSEYVDLFRTNDYRVGFMSIANGQSHFAYTTRDWANMAVEPHFISAGITDIKVDFLPITFTDIFLEHKISAGISDLKVCFSPEIYPQVVSITNDDEFTITIECDLPLYEDLTNIQSAFTVTDSAGTVFAVLSTMKFNERFIILNVANIMSTSGNLTVTYNYNTFPIHSQVEGGCMMQLFSFTQTFKPDLAPPEGFTGHNIPVAITDVSVDFKRITYTNIHQGNNHNITAGITDVSVAFIHIKDINP